MKNGHSVEDIFKRGFQELNQILNHVKKTFNVCNNKLNYYLVTFYTNNIFFYVQKAISAYEETKATE